MPVRRSERWRLLSALGAGILLASGWYPPFNLGALSLLAVGLLLFTLLHAHHSREAAWLGLVCGVAAMAQSYFWVTSYLEWAGLWPLIFYLALVAYQSLFFLIFSLSGYQLKVRYGTNVALLSAPFLWTLLEYLGTLGPLGGPEILGHSQLNVPLLREGAPLLGVNFVSFLAVSATACLLLWLPAFRVRRITKVVPAAILVGLLLITHLGYKMQSERIGAEAERSFQIALVEPQLDPRWYNRGKYLDEIYLAYLHESQRLSSSHAALYIWPENVMPDPVNLQGRWRNRLSRYLASTPQTILLGGPYQGVPVHAHYNAAVLYEGDEISGLYQKQKLFPVGETASSSVPIKWLRSILPMRYSYAALRRGEQTRPMAFQDTLLGLTICYESLFGDLVRRRVSDGAEVLINLTNDSWFMNSSAAEKHFFVGAMRALESGRTFVQSALYGVTGVVGPDGRVRARSGPDARESLHVTVIPHQYQTWSTRLGGWRFAVMALITVLYLLPAVLHRSKVGIKQA